MARSPRHFVPGYPSHVTHRGNNRQRIFHCEGDYRFLWNCIKEAAGEHRVAVNAYVFMGNHVHLLMTPDDPTAISRAMHSASRRYAGYFNKRYERTGTLWEGRFHASLVKTDSYFLTCHRYIDQNPLRAGLARVPEQYPWSSHRFYSMGEVNPLVTAHHAISVLGESDESRRRAYQALVSRPLDAVDLECVRKACRSGRPIGEDVPRIEGRSKKIVPDTNSNLYLTPFLRGAGDGA
jgi:putative transposase